MVNFVSIHVDVIGKPIRVCCTCTVGKTILYLAEEQRKTSEWLFRSSTLRRARVKAKFYPTFQHWWAVTERRREERRNKWRKETRKNEKQTNKETNMSKHIMAALFSRKLVPTKVRTNHLEEIQPAVWGEDYQLPCSKNLNLLQQIHRIKRKEIGKTWGFVPSWAETAQLIQHLQEFDSPQAPAR